MPLCDQAPTGRPGTPWSGPMAALDAGTWCRVAIGSLLGSRGVFAAVGAYGCLRIFGGWEVWRAGTGALWRVQGRALERSAENGRRRQGLSFGFGSRLAACDRGRKFAHIDESIGAGSRSA